MDPLTRNQGAQRPQTVGVRGQTFQNMQAARSASYAARPAAARPLTASRPMATARPISASAATRPLGAAPRPAAGPAYANQTFANTPAREITPTLDPVDNFEPAATSVAKESKKSSSNKVVSIVFVIIAVLAAFAGGIFLGKNWDNIFKKTEEQPVVEKPKAESRDLSSVEIKALSDKVAHLVMADSGSDFIKMDYYRLLPSVVNNTLTDADKLQIAVYSLRNEYITAPDKAESTIATARVEARYKELFGTDLVYVESAYCPNYSLSEDKANYVIGSGCGGGSDNVDMLYKQDYYFKDGFAYVDIAVGSIFANQNSDDATKNTIYTNYYSASDKNPYKTFADFSSLEEFNNFTISTENASAFTHYSLKFELDESENFHFVSGALIEAQPAERTTDTSDETETSSEESTEATDGNAETKTETEEKTEKPSDDVPAKPAEDGQATTSTDQSNNTVNGDDISYKTDPDAPACPRSNPYAICVD